MRIVLWVKGARGVACFKALVEAGENIALVVLQNQPSTLWHGEASSLADKQAIPTLTLENPNAPDSIAKLASHNADIFVLAGYGKILKQPTIDIPKIMCINLHGGMLPEQRGSSPLNWVLITGQDEFGISIIQVDAGVDTGALLNQRKFVINPNDTIQNLHEKANSNFPEMLLETLQAIKNNTLRPELQQCKKSAYYPSRFPDDGLVMFDMLTAQEIHNLIRGLSNPYPGAHSYHKGRKVKLLSSRLKVTDFFGTPGRIYLIKQSSLLICAKDKCLWIDEAAYADDDSPLTDQVQRYDRMATVTQAAEQFFLSQGENK